MKKLLGILLAVAIFGGVAGATYYGIDYLGSNRTATAEAATQTDVTSDETQSETNIQRTSSSSSSDDNATASTDSASYTRLDVSDLVEEALPEVVSITNTQLVTRMGYSSLYDYLYGTGQSTTYEVPASGSGIILAETDDEILIVTNNHVIEDADTLTVTFVDDEEVSANVKGTDSELDIAVIAVPVSEISESTKDQIKVATYHDADDLKVGEGVIVIGNSLGYGQTVTVGYISALDRQIESEDKTYSDLIQVDAAINPGNSGGALVNMDGEVIGINVAKLASTEVEGVGYAIPIYKVMDVIENLSTARTRVSVDESERGRLGVYLNNISSANAEALGIPAGVIIRGFSDEPMEGYGEENIQSSPAKEAGLLKNDIITKIDGQTVSSADDMVSLVSSYRAGETITITYERLENGEYQEHTVDVTLGSQDDETASGSGSASSSNSGLNGNSSSSSSESADTENESSADGEATETEPDSSADTSESGSDSGSDNSQNDYSDDDLYQIFRNFMNRYR